MKLIKLIYIVVFLQVIVLPSLFAQEAGPVSSDAEEARKVKADIEAKYESWADERRKNYTPHWDDDLTGMNSHISNLLDENERLMSERQSLEKEWASLQSATENKNQDNQSILDNISHKQNLMNDKGWKDSSSVQLQEWNQQSIQRNQELEDRKRQLIALDKKTNLGKIKLASLGIDYAPIDNIFKAQEEVEGLRVQLEEVVEREKVLNSKIERIKLSGQKLDPSVAALKTEIDALKAKIADVKKNNGRSTSLKKDLEFTAAELKSKKDDLQKEIQRIKSEIDKIQSNQKMGIANQRVKKLVEEISAVDNQNNDLREEIGALQDNITVLNSHVRKLEYQADAINAIKGNLGQMGQNETPRSSLRGIIPH